MGSNRRLLFAIVGWTWLISCSPLASARQPAQLPGFTLTRLDGISVGSDKLNLPNYWLLVYFEPRSRYADAVLNELKTESAALNDRVIVIVGGVPMAQVKPLIRKYPHLKNVTWYADPKRAAFFQLKVPGSPVVLGVRPRNSLSPDFSLALQNRIGP